MQVSTQQLRAFLLDKKVLNKTQLEKAEKISTKSKSRLEEVLLSEKILSESDLIQLKAYILGIPFVDLRKADVKPEILKIIPEPIARENNIVAIGKNGNDLEVAMIDPTDLQTIDFIKKKTNLKIRPRLTSSEGIKAVLKKYQQSLEAEFGEIIKNRSRKKRIAESGNSQETRR
jgi:type IV pilus assembly protein PilB